MAKDVEMKDRKEKKDKSEKRDKKEKEKEKRSDRDGVVKPSKKDKKEKKDKSPSAALLETLEHEKPGSTSINGNGDLTKVLAPPIGALVPFANPLADGKVQKKVLKSVKKAAKHKSLKRGVKEVVKALRKSATTGPPPGVVILAADISPMDVISHIPVLCEDHNVPYLYITSRAELGAAGSTKRPTSVVMVSPEQGGKKKAGDEAKEGEESFKEVYQDLLKVVQKEGSTVRI